MRWDFEVIISGRRSLYYFLDPSILARFARVIRPIVERAHTTIVKRQVLIGFRIPWAQNASN
jgi:hypothetical protein